MIGPLIRKAREDRKISRGDIARGTDMNIGHLMYVETRKRSPSLKALKAICKFIGIPYLPMIQNIDRDMTEEQEKYNVIKHIPTSKLLTVTLDNNLTDCPSSIPEATLAVRVTDDSMAPKLPNGSIAFVELYAPLQTRDIGLFNINGKMIIRKFSLRKDGIALRPLNKEFNEIILSKNDEFYILGKVLLKHN